MRQFYLGKNSSGYYRVYFVEPVTSCRGPGKVNKSVDPKYPKSCSLSRRL